MLIEVTDRQYWIGKIDSRIAAYEQERSRIDTEYEQHWRRARWWRPAKPESEKPPIEWPFYPTSCYYYTLDSLKDLRKVFLAGNTGQILLSKDELILIGAISG